MKSVADVARRSVGADRAFASSVGPKICFDYPFTTLVPEPGVVPLAITAPRSLMFRPIPGAFLGRRLRPDFWRHIERAARLSCTLDTAAFRLTANLWRPSIIEAELWRTPGWPHLGRGLRADHGAPLCHRSDRHPRWPFRLRSRARTESGRPVLEVASQ